ncbi:hypothetical protein GGI19_004607 [Coemansia pectinata]|uniref:Peptidase M16 C-terminal domain-containing protein n=1 Tax=Coemansia pectinata TaxID=1052879 RepID=A0A9W8L895_9FUNG|nr:hypothetical protein GGI19_004607 [Coemansia pectinata]
MAVADLVVFCGSEKYPYRGYIDAVSSHNLGQPLNASTYDDMTVFKYVGLSQEGAANVLPVVLDHIMHPLIQDSQFATEVYHVDQDGRQQGVVLSEMSDFAYRESAVRSLNLRQMIFPPTSTYAWECGGLPQSIESLSIEEVIDYHKEFYSYSNLTLILIGAYDECPAAIFNVLDDLDTEISASPPPLRRPMPAMLPKWRKARADYVFASEKSQTGSMTFAWEGPPAEDIETCVALEMLIDYMKIDPASPLRKRFTHRPVPIAGNIDFGLLNYIPTAIVLSFTEVPFVDYISHAAAAAATSAKRRVGAPAMTYPSPADTCGPLDLSKLHDDVNGLFASNYYRKQLVSTMTYVVEHWLSNHWQHFNSYLAKRTACISTKFASVAMSQKDNQGILYKLARDAVIHRLSPGSASTTQPTFGSRGRLFSLRHELGQKDCAFWKALVQKWFLNGRMMHVATLPDPKMGIQIEAERNLAQRNHIENMDPTELEANQKKLAEALESTKVNIPRDVLAALPPTPDISQVQMPKFTGYNFNHSSESLLLIESPFGMGRVLVVPGEVESKFQISFPLAGLPSELWSYLPLFVRLATTQVGLVIPHAVADTVLQDSCLMSVKPSGMPLVYLNSEQVDCAMGEALTDHKVCIGDYYSHDSTGHWPVEVLTLFGSTKRKDLLRAFKLMSLKMMFGDFGVDTIFKVANWLKKDLIAARGTGTSLLIDTFPWLRIPGRLDACAIAKYDPSDSATHAMASHTGSEPFGRSLNLYHQIAFLTTLTKSLSAAMNEDDIVATEADSVSDAITQIRAHFANCTAATGLAHIALPKCTDGAEARDTLSTFVGEWQACSSAWRENHQIVTVPATPYELPTLYSNSHRIYTPPRKRRRAVVVVPAKTPIRLSPNSRAGSRNFSAVSPPLGIHLMLASLQTSYVGVQVPLIAQRDPSDTRLVSLAKQLEKRPDTDIYALHLLCIVFNRSEGLVKNAIRGRGYAYGVGIHPNVNNGNLAVYISHAVDPLKAMTAFWDVMEQIRSEVGWNEAIDEFQLSAARSIYYFRSYTGFAESLVSEDASFLFRGFSGVEEYLPWMRSHVESIKIADLRRVFLKYFVPFITKGTPSLYIVATPQFLPETGAEFLQQLNGNAYGAKFKAIDMSVLDPIVTI